MPEATQRRKKNTHDTTHAKTRRTDRKTPTAIEEQEPEERRKETQENKNAPTKKRGKQTSDTRIWKSEIILKTENGIRAINNASLNPDSTIEDQMQRDVIKNLTGDKNRTLKPPGKLTSRNIRGYAITKYRAIKASATKNEATEIVQGRTSVATHSSDQKYISKIITQIDRVLRAALESENQSDASRS